MMLAHRNLPRPAARLGAATGQTLNVDKVRPGDLGGKANTAAFTGALVSRIASGRGRG